MSLNRRNFLVGTAAAAAVQAGVGAAAQKPASGTGNSTNAVSAAKPNIILYLSDQFRWDFVGANGLNSSTPTPNIDALAARGKNFTHAVTNQPVCAPARSVLFTSRYATETGVWHNGLALDRSLPTLAGELRKAGYSCNLIGKWHLALESAAEGGSTGPVKAEDRGGFLDLWEGANAIENTSHPYEGTIWDRDNNPITYKDEYRVDFLTDRAERFLRQKHDKPFFLFISQLGAAPAERHALSPSLPRVRPRASSTATSPTISALCPAPGRPSFPTTTAASSPSITRSAASARSSKRSILPTTPSSSSSAITAATS